MAANGYLVDYEHTLLGPLRGPGPIIQMSATPTRIQRASPALREHTDAILGSLGFGPSALDELRAAGVIG